MPFLAAIPAVVAAAGIGGGATIGASLLNRPGKASKAAEQQATRQSQAETQAIEDRNRRLRDLETLIKTATATRAPTYNITREGGSVGGAGTADNFFEGVRPMTDINLLMRLAQMSGGGGSGATQGLLATGAQERASGRQMASGLGRNAAFIVAELLKQRSGPQSGGYGDPIGSPSAGYA